MPQPVLVIHGGCFTTAICSSSDKQWENEAKEKLKESLLAGYKILRQSGTSLDAVVEAVRLLEDAPHFNAGKGSSYSNKLTIEMDAGVMNGEDGKAGGVSNVTRVKNPVVLALEVMRRTPHAILCAAGAEDFGTHCPNVVMVEPEYFATDRRYNQVLKILEKQGQQYTNAGGTSTTQTGTVGAVALDSEGRLASASSTGGLAGRLPGRVSDSSIAGAGFFADSRLAVSGTGDGDFFIRRQICYRVAASFQDCSNLDKACCSVLSQHMNDCLAGLIAVDINGFVSMPFNTSGMYRGYAKGDDLQFFV